MIVGWRIFWWLGVALLVVSPARSQPLAYSEPEIKAALMRVIEDQLVAFRNDDWEAAYQLASESFRRRMPFERFSRIIQQSYPIIWKNTRVDFGLPTDNSRLARVPLRVHAELVSASFDYLLAFERGRWLITGVLPSGESAPF